jgi:hypothetical protein
MIRTCDIIYKLFQAIGNCISTSYMSNLCHYQAFSYIHHADLPELTLSSSSQCDLITSVAFRVMTRKCPDTVLYPLSSLEANLTMLMWSA